MSIGEYRNQLSEKATQAAWRQSALAEPYSDHHQRLSATALDKLARNIARVPLDDPTLIKCYEIEKALRRNLLDGTWYSFHDEFLIRGKDAVGSCEFDSDKDYTDRFLQRYLAALHRCLVACCRFG